ncbi:DUF2917 domain-containing protein [Chitinibacter sp. SCUT-21]|uniref:DUF2917 domain-containing protein n=1 Tax=Chitinibacter sp. SCUT-21 TaxID=2970891 RepID=UPI0035A64B29
MQAIQLPKSSLSTLSGHKQQWIICEHGTIWLSDDGHDVILQRGQNWQVKSDYPVVIEAFANSRFNIQSEQFCPATALQKARNCFSDFIHQYIHRPTIKTATV